MKVIMEDVLTFGDQDNPDEYDSWERTWVLKPESPEDWEKSDEDICRMLGPDLEGGSEGPGRGYSREAQVDRLQQHIIVRKTEGIDI